MQNNPKSLNLNFLFTIINATGFFNEKALPFQSNVRQIPQSTVGVSKESLKFRILYGFC